MKTRLDRTVGLSNVKFVVSESSDAEFTEVCCLEFGYRVSGIGSRNGFFCTWFLVLSSLFLVHLLDKRLADIDQLARLTADTRHPAPDHRLRRINCLPLKLN